MRGNPDQGSGWYCSRMDMKTWYEFNTSVRSHQNWLESLPFIIFLPPIAGILFPLPALICVIVMLVTRILFTIAYIHSITALRAVSFAIFNMAIMVLVACSIMTAAKIIQVGDYKYRANERRYIDELAALREKYNP